MVEESQNNININNNNITKLNKVNTTANKKRSVMILGDSIIKGIEGYKMKQAMRNSNTNVYVKSFPGATIDDMYSYEKPSLKHEPNTIIIHCGTNNLKEEKTADDQGVTEQQAAMT